MNALFNHPRKYSLRKSRNILKWVFVWYNKKSQELSPSQVQTLEHDMSILDEALQKKDRCTADETAHRLEKFASIYCKKTTFEYVREILVALVFALIIATIVRQMWFELYEIPTGSMRPTFREQDHLTVTKTAFGINIPLKTNHFYFDPSLVQRTSVVIFSGDGLPLPDVHTKYFGIFPYTKRYIKRCLGKPGDSLYFYGGSLYGVDKDGKDLTELRNANWMQNLEYVPFLTFEGTLSSGPHQSILLNQMHKPAGKLTFNDSGQIQGEIFNGKKWIKDQPLAQLSNHDTIETYSDLLGIRNYALARLLTKEQLGYFAEDWKSIDEGVLYLQLIHTPSLNFPKPLIFREGAGINIGIPGYSAIIPLQERHLNALMSNLYTARFVIRDGIAHRYTLEEHYPALSDPRFDGIPNGTYEFYFGEASKIHWGGISTKVEKTSPLYSLDPNNVQKLFNLGIEMNTRFSPRPNNYTLFPHRYAYFRNGDLFIMGAPIIRKDDPTLIAFLESENERQKKALPDSPYVAFKDYGPPLKNGEIDVEFVRTFGVTIPQDHYLVLGDNHAMSADSRIFGFVPNLNLQGAPCWIIWPPGDRLGPPPQKPYPLFNLPRIIIWSLAGLIGLIWFLISNWKSRQPIFRKKEK